LVRGSSGAYKLVEISDWSRYDNGTYVGHVYRETRGSLEPITPLGKTGTNFSGIEYNGRFYVLEQTLRDMSKAARELDDVFPASFVITIDGNYQMKDDHGFPELRGFPSFPSKPVLPGEKWTARFTRAVDPFNSGRPVLMPLIAEYQYRGEELYKDIPVYRVFAKYATRYKTNNSAKSVPFIEAFGTHEADILIRKDDGLPLMIRDRLDETFRKADDSTVRFKGFTLTFSEGRPPVDRGAVIASIQGTVKVEPETPSITKIGSTSTAGQLAVAADTPVEPDLTAHFSMPDGEPVRTGIEAPPISPDTTSDFELALYDESGKPLAVSLEETPAGVKLTVRDLRFVADSDAILPEERGRLDIIARALRDVPEKTFLVEGHTAAVGKPAGELELSIQRAKRVVNELSIRGIASDRFIYKGWGGTRPLADNATDFGRSKNRRVEITILD
jgi:outer membrane protein OmpA-like peptidoglycan-associated protein